jgi:hypothetical protein
MAKHQPVGIGGGADLGRVAAPDEGMQALQHRRGRRLRGERPHRFLPERDGPGPVGRDLDFIGHAGGVA